LLQKSLFSVVAFKTLTFHKLKYSDTLETRWIFSDSIIRNVLPIQTAKRLKIGQYLTKLRHSIKCAICLGHPVGAKVVICGILLITQQLAFQNIVQQFSLQKLCCCRHSIHYRVESTRVY